MVSIEPKLSGNIGHDALRVWLDFWELTGRQRVTIIRREESGGDLSKMVEPEVTVTMVQGAQAIIVGRASEYVSDRAGEIPVDKITLEMIDSVRDSNYLKINGIEHAVDAVQERDMGSFTIWIVETHRTGQ